MRTQFAIIASLFAFLFFTPEKAIAACSTATDPVCDTKGEAFQNIQTFISTRAYTNGDGLSIFNCANQPQLYESETLYQVQVNMCYGAQQIAGYQYRTVHFPANSTCLNTAPPAGGTGDFNAGNDGDIRCFRGCQQTINETSNSFSFTNRSQTCATETFNSTQCGTGYAWSVTFSICTKLPQDSDGDGEPDTTDQWPFDPLRKFDTDSDGVADSFDAFPTDPTENADSDSDGVGNNNDIADDSATNGKDAGTGNETDNTSTQGGTCNNQPVSTGDAITAQIAYQTWATRCATEKSLDELKKQTATVTGDISNCAAAFSCVGNNAQCATAYASRVTICPNQAATINKLEEIRQAIAAQGVNTGGTSSIQFDATGLSQSLGTEGLTGNGTTNSETTLEEFDSSGFLGGVGQCLQLPTLTVMGTTIDIGSFPHICEFFQAGAALILLAGAVSAFKVLAGGI